MWKLKIFILLQIVENSGISKTTKLRLFNDHSLKPVIRLYSWKGPVQKKMKRKRKLGEEEVPVAFVSIFKNGFQTKCETLFVIYFWSKLLLTIYLIV